MISSLDSKSDTYLPHEVSGRAGWALYGPGRLCGVDSHQTSPRRQARGSTCRSGADKLTTAVPVGEFAVAWLAVVVQSSVERERAELPYSGPPYLSLHPGAWLEVRLAVLTRR